MKEEKLQLIWIDLTVGKLGTELPERLATSFDVRAVPGSNLTLEMVSDWSPAVICCDYDYPDRHLLDRMVWLKQQLPSVPIFPMFVQHSESLAVWTFRSGAIDYLVKPVPAEDIDRLVERIYTVADSKRNQSARSANYRRSVLPNDLPNAPKGLKQKLAPAIFFVQNNYNQRIYSDAIARLCGMSTTHFSRAFRQTYDITFQDFLLRYRVSEACRQLRIPGAVVTDVAYAVGFSDASYFSRVFKRYIGVSPSDFLAGRNDGAVESRLLREAEESQSSSQIVKALDNISA